MLYFIFTVDGDWNEYFDITLSESERLPRPESLQKMVQAEIKMARQLLDGRFIHFIHTSPRARDFFIKKPFLELWKELVKNKGDTGLHCHEDDPCKDYYYQDTLRMREVVSERASAFRKAGLTINCYRSGFLGFADEMVKILEENKILFDFSCEPGRRLTHEKTLICDWVNAPTSLYRMRYGNPCEAGDSKVYEIPVGRSKGKYLYFEKSSVKEIEKIAIDLKESSIETKSDTIVSVLTHTYEYESKKTINDIEDKVNVLKKHGKFLNLEELENHL